MIGPTGDSGGTPKSTGKGPKGKMAGTSWRNWVLNHDSSWLFIVAYIGLAVVLSLAISLFWLVAVVAVHGVLEWFVHWRQQPSVVHCLARVLWELKLDIGLILFALALSVYLDVVMGVAGLSAASRGAAAASRGAQAAGRFMAWQRAVRAVLLTLDDLVQIARMATGVASRKRNSPGDEHIPRAKSCEESSFHPWGGWAARWTWGDRLSLGFGAVFAVALLIAPLITHHGPGCVAGILLKELHPWP